MVLFRALVVVMALWMVDIPSINATGPCLITWTVEPSRPEPASCDVTLVPTMIVCTVLFTHNTTVQWYHSKLSGGINGSEVPSGIQNSTSTRSSSILQINNNIMDGYYWCQVEIHSMIRIEEASQNPSKVLYIEKVCDAEKKISQCILSASSPSSRCAYGEMENITIIPVVTYASCDVDDNNNQSTEDEYKDKLTTSTEDEEKYTTENKMETSTSTEDSIEGNGAGTGATTENISGATDSSSTSGGDATTFTATESTVANNAGGLGNSVIWIIIGVGIALLLMAIAVLLVVIVYLKCSKKKVKDNSSMPNQFLNRAYMTEEFELPQSLANSQDNKITEVNTALDGNHIYSEIPTNFTIADVSGDSISPNQLTSQQNSHNPFQHSLPGQYEDIPPITKEGQNDSRLKHEYESVVSEKRDDYNRLQLSGSKSHLSSSISRPSISPPTYPSNENPPPLFDSPEYSQLNKTPHANIYRSSSNTSNSGGSSQSHDSQNTVPFQYNSSAVSKNNVPFISEQDDEQGHLYNVLENTKTEIGPASEGEAVSIPFDDERGHTYQVLEDTRSKVAYGDEVISNRIVEAPLLDTEQGHTYQVLENPRDRSHKDEAIKKLPPDVQGHTYQVLDDTNRTASVISSELLPPPIPPHDSKQGGTLEYADRNGDGTFVSNTAPPPIPPHDKYVSELGHTYQVLEEMNLVGEGALASTNTKLPSIPPRDKYVSEIGHTYQVLENAGAVSRAIEEDIDERAPPIPSPHKANLSGDDDDEEDDKDGRARRSVYHTLDYNSNGGKNTPPDQPAYDVIDRSVQKSTSDNRSSLDNELAYDVLDRSKEGKPTNGTTRPSRTSESGYSRIERNVGTNRNDSSVAGRRMASNGPGSVFSIADRNNTQEHVDRTPPPPPPPPSYNTLDLSGMTSQKKCQCNENCSPFYHSLELNVEKESNKLL